MMMKFNFGYGPLVLRGTSCDGFARISVTLDDPNSPYEDIPLEVIENMAEKLYSTFNVNDVSLYKDDECVCTIEKKEEEGE